MKTTLAQALASGVSWKILDLLITGEKTELEICRSLGLSSRMVRIQLEKLLESGLASVDTRTSPSGEEVRVFSVSLTAKSVGYPPRSYEYLSEALIIGLNDSLGAQSTKIVLRDIGLKMGEGIGRNLISKTDTRVWDPKTYAEFFVKRFLAEMKTYPRLVSTGRRKLAYEQLNCPFQELADKFPGLICDVLDEAIHEGIDRKLGTETTRLACKGHGDATCKFSVSWPERARGLKIELKS